MKNLKAHHHIAIVSMLIFGVVSIWTWGTVVFAGTAGTTVQVFVGPPDSCPNVPGYQPDIPEGMLVDGDGNCYTPPPPPIDLCANMTGDQEIIPSGYYRDDNGDCLLQPAVVPNDVCPNLTGTQTVVPDGYINNIDGDCIKPPADMCSNIPGVQVLVPSDMQRADNNDCFTPTPNTVSTPSSPSGTAAPQSPWVAPEKPRGPQVIGTETDFKNVPSFLDPLVFPFVDAIPETVKEALRSMPPIVAQVFPYFTFAVLGIAAAVMGAQAANEIRATRRIASLTKRERAVAEEKETFIALASHYLQTPLRMMEASLASANNGKDLAGLRDELRALGGDINTILTSMEGNTALSTIRPPRQDSEAHPFTASAYFWIPIVGTVLIVWMSNFLLGVVGDVELGAYNLLAQAGAFIGASALFYSAIRTHYLQQHARAFTEKLLQHEETLDAARNDFIARSTLTLAHGLGKIANQRQVLAGNSAKTSFDEGYDSFVHLLKKFNLLSEIQAGVIGASENFDVRAAIEEITAFYQPQLSAKRLKIVNHLKKTNISQRRSLFTFVLSSLIDNAIKFSNEGGTITIKATPHEHSLTVQISDYGAGIPEDTTSMLFKPFSRGASALEFNYDGLGFSLFLDKIIMDAVGGGITATSVDHKKTTFSVTTPV